MADEFCKVFNRMMSKYTIEDTSKPAKRKCHRDSTMSDAEIVVIMILFHNSGFRCLKHFYLDHVCKHLKHLFPKTVSYNRFVELQKRIIIPMIIFIKKVLLGKCGIQFITKLKSNMKGAMMSVSDKVLLRKRAIIETVNDELKNIAQIEHSRHRSLHNFTVNLLSAVAAYCFFPKKPTINIVRPTDNQLTLF